MGNNLYSVCHKCKEKIMHWRGEEHLTILPFYHEHKKCLMEDINNVQTVMDNVEYQRSQEPFWMSSDGGYKTIKNEF